MSHEGTAAASPSVTQSIFASLKHSPLVLPLVGLIVVSAVMASR